MCKQYMSLESLLCSIALDFPTTVPATGQQATMGLLWSMQSVQETRPGFRNVPFTQETPVAQMWHLSHVVSWKTGSVLKQRWIQSSGKVGAHVCVPGTWYVICMHNYNNDRLCSCLIISKPDPKDTPSYFRSVHRAGKERTTCFFRHPIH